MNKIIHQTIISFRKSILLSFLKTSFQEKENLLSLSHCSQTAISFFDFQNIEKDLVANPKKVWNDGNYFTSKRFIVIQMK